MGTHTKIFPIKVSCYRCHKIFFAPNRCFAVILKFKIHFCRGSLEQK
ncbi:hypothetical protein LEP1GSC013_1965 [Leptospira interrogans serovar Valbuzzi str. Duyster]|nr:hypothetical protein LEP1GSC013_1965 [Leptospira interrogans serovar Valbuzzi str. Duyster]ENO73728.1 hypothetical protein LEP1GSC012_3600 [Leptospira interrogans serovar Valbuzzi str. Valbuzzi]